MKARITPEQRLGKIENVLDDWLRCTTRQNRMVGLFGIRHFDLPFSVSWVSEILGMAINFIRTSSNLGHADINLKGRIAHLLVPLENLDAVFCGSVSSSAKRGAVIMAPHTPIHVA